MRPATVAELSEAVRCSSTVRIVGSGSKGDFGVASAALEDDKRQSESGFHHGDTEDTERHGGSEASCQGPIDLDMTGYAGIVSHEPADQVIVARAGTLFAELQEELAKSRLCVPIPAMAEHGLLCGGFPGTVGGLISMNLPHGLFAQCGGPRDWVLGMTVVRGDGTLAKSGSRVVKSVAGYDVHKLFIGARGTLGVVAEVALRTFPIRALPRGEFRTVKPYEAGSPLWIQRVLPRDFAAATAAAGESLLAEDRASATLWASVESGEQLPRYAEDWVLRAGCNSANLPTASKAVRKLMCATKAALDPSGKFNPGAMGVV